MAKPARVGATVGSLLIAVFAAGCSQSEDSAMTGDPVVATGPGDGGAMRAGPEAPDAAPSAETCHDAAGCGCEAIALDAVLPADLELDTRDHESVLQGSCGGTGAPEVALRFTAPSTGRFTFSTEGSRFNTVLYALTGDCAGEELACNDDRTALESGIELDLAAGQSIVLVIDGFEGQAGRAQLRAAALERSSCCESATAPGCGSQAVEACVCELDDFCCATAWDEVCVEFAANECGVCASTSACGVAARFDEADAVLSAELDGTRDAASASCGHLGAPDVVFGFTAEQAGVYTFTTHGSGVSDTVLALLDGDGCAGAELACNDDDGSEYASRVTVELAAGQSVTAVVESWDDELGEVRLTVSAGAEPTAASCTPAPLAGELPLSVTGDVDGGIGALEPSCALFGSRGEIAYEFSAAQDGTYRFDTLGSEADTILQILDGDCSGTELACNDDSADGELAAQVELALLAGQTVTVVVDSFDGAGSYVLNVARTSDAQDAAE